MSLPLISRAELVLRREQHSSLHSLKHLVFAMLALKHIFFPYPCKGRDSVEVELSQPRRREARPGSQWCTVWSWHREQMKPFPWARLFCALSSCNVLHLTVQRVKDQPFVGKVIVLKTESLFICINFNYSSSGENAGEPSLAAIWKGCC